MRNLTKLLVELPKNVVLEYEFTVILHSKSKIMVTNIFAIPNKI